MTWGRAVAIAAGITMVIIAWPVAAAMCGVLLLIEGVARGLDGDR